MEYRTLELNIVSAKDLKDVNLFSKMDVYAVVSLSGDPLQKVKTPVHRDGGTNPTWNFPMKLTVNESLAYQNRLSLEIKLMSDRTLAGDTLIGTVHVPLRELLDNPGDGNSFRHVSYQVRTPSGKSKGSLNFSYKFNEQVAAAAKAAPAPAPAYPPPAVISKQEPAMVYPPPATDSKHEPVMAYPAAAGSSSVPYAAPYPPPPQQQQYAGGYGYPPPQQGYGYPPQPGYGYPPQPGYGYPPVQKPAKAKNKFGMGLGAGLLGGALGGLLIGDMVSDVGSYDAGYDAGFDDAADFDF